MLDLSRAETEAVTLGAHITNNSFMPSASCFEPKDFDTPGVTYVATPAMPTLPQSRWRFAASSRSAALAIEKRFNL